MKKSQDYYPRQMRLSEKGEKWTW